MKIDFLQFLILFLPFITFLTGILSLILWRKNLVLLIIALEICFIGSYIGFILASSLIDDVVGFIFSLIGLTIAGAEVSLGLALTIVVYRKFDSIYSKKLEYLKS